MNNAIEKYNKGIKSSSNPPLLKVIPVCYRCCEHQEAIGLRGIGIA